MDNLLASLYNNMDDASRAANDLMQNGFDPEQIRMFFKDKKWGLFAALGDVKVKDFEGGGGQKIDETNLDDRIMRLGIPTNDARRFTDKIKDGSALLALQTSDAMSSQAASIMDRHNPIDIGRPGAQTGRERGLETGRDMDLDRSREQETNIPIVEEELRVGKRQVDTGGIRVHKFVREVPVEEQVRLQKEEIDVERHKVDRPATAEDLDMEEETYEFRTSAEEPVVDKQARVVEEVEIDKDIEEETHTVRDTLRRSDVEIERTGEMDLSAYDSDFRSHFTTTYSGTGTGYEDFRPYYAYGYELAQDQRYRNRSWNEVEREAQRDWRRRYPNENWDEYSEAVRTGWETGRTRR